MKTTLNLIAAPTAMQPGNYVKAAYADALAPVTTSLQVEAFRSGDSWEITMQWACPKTVNSCRDETDRFVDAAAFIVPSHENANWITMGSADAPVEGVLWRADRSELWRVDANGMGAAQRSPAPTQWRVQHDLANGIYQLRFLFPKWDNLNRFERGAFAVWQGAQRQRAGLKSVSAGWVSLHG